MKFLFLLFDWCFNAAGRCKTWFYLFKQIWIKYLDDSLGWVAFDDEGVACWPREPGFRLNSISELDGARRLPAKLLRDPAAAPALGIPDSATALRPWIELDDRIPTDLQLLIHVGWIWSCKLCVKFTEMFLHIWGPCERGDLCNESHTLFYVALKFRPNSSHRRTAQLSKMFRLLTILFWSVENSIKLMKSFSSYSSEI